MIPTPRPTLARVAHLRLELLTIRAFLERVHSRIAFQSPAQVTGGRVLQEAINAEIAAMEQELRGQS